MDTLEENANNELKDMFVDSYMEFYKQVGWYDINTVTFVSLRGKYNLPLKFMAHLEVLVSLLECSSHDTFSPVTKSGQVEIGLWIIKTLDLNRKERKIAIRMRNK